MCSISVMTSLPIIDTMPDTPNMMKQLDKVKLTFLKSQLKNNEIILQIKKQVQAQREKEQKEEQKGEQKADQKKSRRKREAVKYPGTYIDWDNFYKEEVEFWKNVNWDELKIGDDVEDVAEKIEQRAYDEMHKEMHKELEKSLNINKVIEEESNLNKSLNDYEDTPKSFPK